jgi:ribonucleoside-diphosphate reductase alpha chain
MRQRLPHRRAADVVIFAHEGRRWTATFGRFPDGKLAEVFLDARKESPLAEVARESALLASLGLQHGCHVETIRHALDGRDAGPLAAALSLIAPDRDMPQREP